MKLTPLVQTSPGASCRVSDVSESQRSAPSRLRGTLSASSSGKSLSLENTGDDHSRLCDAVLSAHFTAATQNARLEGLEARAAEVDIQMNEVKVELAEAEAQEAVQCVKWREKYMMESNEVNAYREKAEFAESRLQSSAMVAAEVSAEHLQVECLRTEVVERGAHWAVERERFFDEIYQLRVSVAEHEGSAAGFELQVQRASEEAAQITVVRCNEMEALAHARAEAGRAISRAEASEAARALAEEKRLRATASVESMKVELQTIISSEEACIMRARQDARSEVEAVRQARARMEELRKESEQNREATERLHALEEERRRDAEAAIGLHADARQALENLFCFVGRRENHSEGSVENLREIEEQFLAESKATSAAENAAILAAQAEARKASAAQKSCDLLRSELEAQSRVQQDLHTELQALSSAAAAVRAVATAKEEKIVELQATSRIMLAELAHNASPQARNTTELRENSANSPSSVETDKVVPQSLYDVMSSTGSVCVSDMTSVSKAGGSTTSTDAPPLRTASIDLPPLASSGAEVTRNEENAQPAIFQAAAFLNVAAARAAAAASAVEAFMPFASQAQNDALSSTTGQLLSAKPIINPDAPNRTTSSQASDTTPASRTQSEVSAPQRNGRAAETPNWEAAQFAMTEQIRKDIGLLRKALASSGMAGIQADDAVKQALLRATESMGLQYSSDNPTEEILRRAQSSQPPPAFRSASPPSRRPVPQPVAQAGRNSQQRQFMAASVEPDRQTQQPELFQRSRSDSRPKTPTRLQNASNLDNENVQRRPSIGVVAQSTCDSIDSSARSIAQPKRSKPLQQTSVPGASVMLNASPSSHRLPNAVAFSRSPGAASRELRQNTAQQRSATAGSAPTQPSHFVSRSPDGRHPQAKAQAPIKEGGELRTASQPAHSPGTVPTPQGGRVSMLTKVGYAPLRSASPSVPKNGGTALQGVVNRLTSKRET